MVLTKGYFLFGEGNSSGLRNLEIKAIQDLKIFGNPDRQGRCLYGMYQALMALLRDGEAPIVPIERYFSLPLTAGKYSYEFAYGFVSELGACPEHGNFLRKIGRSAGEGIDILPGGAAGRISECVVESGRRRVEGPSGQRSRLVWIYNPERLQLSELLLSPQGFIAFDEIVVSDTHILIPIYYSVKEGIVSGCRACGKFFRPELNERGDL